MVESKDLHDTAVDTTPVGNNDTGKLDGPRCTHTIRKLAAYRLTCTCGSAGYVRSGLAGMHAAPPPWCLHVQTLRRQLMLCHEGLSSGRRLDLRVSAGPEAVTVLAENLSSTSVGTYSYASHSIP